MTEQRHAHLIFGAYGGIGSSLARRLSDRGATLAVSGRDPGRTENLANELGALALPGDATDFGTVLDVVKRASEHMGGLDGVVNCVGSVLIKPAHLTRPEEWNDIVQKNLTTSFAIVRAAVQPMRSNGGSIVLISTAAAAVGLPNHEAIAAVKGGVDALVRSAAATYGPLGIRVNAVAPGLVETPLTERITGNERAREASRSMHALGRLGRADDVAASIDWLLSDEASWVTGQTVGVDGGLGAVRSA